MSDSTRRRNYPLDLKPGPAASQGPRPTPPPAPGAVRSPQLPGKTPDRSAVPGHGRLPVPKNARPIPPLTEFGTAQRIMEVFALAPGEEDTKERWEQATASYEEIRKGNPNLLTPIRPARSFVGVEEGLAAKSLIAAEELVPLPAEATSAAGTPSAEIKGDAQASQAVTQEITPAPAPVAPPATPTAPTTVDLPANAVIAADEPRPSGQALEVDATSGAATVRSSDQAATSPAGVTSTGATAATPLATPVNPRLAKIPQTGWIEGDGSASCPPAYPIKGNASSMIYHVPGSRSYGPTIPELCFSSEEAAQAAGFRRPRRS